MIQHTTHYPFSFVLLLSLGIIPACIHKKDIDKQNLYITPHTIQATPPTAAETPPAITIWVHGTIFFKKPPLYQLYYKSPTFMKATDFADNDYFHFNHIAHLMENQDPEHFSADEFYIFCWSGHFSIRERKIAAEKLYKELLVLLKQYEQKYHTYPIIRIIAHSHGGNVALHMAKLWKPTSPLTIRSLILLACPVQEKTMHLIDTPLFQRIYSLYSSLDFVQVLAPQLRQPEYIKHTGKRGYKLPTFSSRLFPQHPHVIQAKIKVDHYPISHTYFSSIAFAKILPDILHKLDAWDTHNEKSLKTSTYKLLCVYQHKKKRRQ